VKIAARKSVHSITQTASIDSAWNTGQKMMGIEKNWNLSSQP